MKNINLNPLKLSFLGLILFSLLLVACGNPKSSQATASVPITTEAQAVSVASSYVPLDIVAKAQITAQVGTFSSRTSAYKRWDVQFSDISITKAELGWIADDKTEFGDTEPYTEVEISLNATTGELVLRQAVIPVLWGNQTGLPTDTTVSREQAIALAATQFPSSVILQSEITTQIIAPGNLGLNYLWDVFFDDFTITHDALVVFGWSPSDNTFLPNYSEYHVANVEIDTQTGAIVWKGASFWRMSPPPLSTTTLKTS